MKNRKNHERALSALLNTSTVKDAARESGISERTLFRLLNDKDFAADYQTARRGLYEQNIARLQSLHAGAVETLQRNLTCENPSVEVRAAQIVIEASRKDFETMEILERLETLEDEHKKQAEKDGKRNNRTRF